ncbi:MAG TPA: alpha/beta hydrolase [Stellaceae bacterium]|nr:alpha/beta hydrolase [Stellaceae bacterium]
MDHGETGPGEICRRDFFYIGGEYAGPPGKEVMHGQMYVEVLTPRRPRRPYPLVLFHGAGQTATNWLGTPDGRPGWAEHFAAAGYTVYLVDQPARGRSPWQPGIDGELAVFTAGFQEWLLTASAEERGWPQAARHTQWPGSGRRGDPIFDAFQATQVPYLADPVETQRLVRTAGVALLDRIGAAILLTHSQAGTFGWLLADARPQLVKAVVALEPSGPPFENAIVAQGKGRAWGVADLKLTYDPPAASPADLALEQQDEPDHPDLIRCWQQKAPARRLPNLAEIPVLIVTGEASYHAVYDHCTAKYLSEAGVAVTFVRLEDRGIRGNGHMLMLEKNSAEIAALVIGWLGEAPAAR